jgi:hypothetical protein
MNLKVRAIALCWNQGLTEQAKQQAESLWLNVESYLRNTGKSELNPEGIKKSCKRF